MRTGYQSLAYWMRRPTGFASSELIPFYTEIVGLPLMRDYGSASLFWAGEDLVFEIKVDDHPGDVPQDPATAALTPLFRTYDLDATEARLTAHGYPPVARESGAHHRTSWIIGADRLLIGFTERAEDSPVAADAEALRRRRAGHAEVLDGVEGSLPDDLQYLCRVRRRVADVEAVADFYRNRYGLDDVHREDGAVLFSLGDTVILEIAPGGTAGPPPSDRTALADGIITRIRGWDSFVTGLDQASVPRCGAQVDYPTGTRLAYHCDVEGNLIGIEERTLWGRYPEDLEADRRWAVRNGANAADADATVAARAAQWPRETDAAI